MSYDTLLHLEEQEREQDSSSSEVAGSYLPGTTCIHIFFRKVVYVRICIHTYIHLFIHTYIYTHVFINIYKHEYILHIHKCIQAFIHTYINTYIHTYIHIYIYVHTYLSQCSSVERSRRRSGCRADGQVSFRRDIRHLSEHRIHSWAGPA